MTEPLRLVSRQLSNVDQWELYEVEGPKGKVVIGLRPLSEYRHVEYEIWNDLASPPECRGSIPCEEAADDRWASASRTDLLTRVIEDATPPRAP